MAIKARLVWLVKLPIAVTVAIAGHNALPELFATIDIALDIPAGVFLAVIGGTPGAFAIVLGIARPFRCRG